MSVQPRSAAIRLACLSAMLCGALAASPAFASFHLMQIEQVIGGVNGDTNLQAIQLRMRAWRTELVSAARLRAWDANGANPVLVVDMDADVANGAAGGRVLIASPQFAAVPSPQRRLQHDQPIPASYLTAGKLTFEDRRRNRLLVAGLGRRQLHRHQHWADRQRRRRELQPAVRGPLPSSNTAGAASSPERRRPEHQQRGRLRPHGRKRDLHQQRRRLRVPRADRHADPRRRRIDPDRTRPTERRLDRTHDSDQRPQTSTRTLTTTPTSLTPTPSRRRPPTASTPTATITALRARRLTHANATPSTTPTPSATPTVTPSVTPGGVILDIDDDGTTMPLTDGILILRYLFGFRGSTLIAGAVGAGCRA